MEIQDYLNLVTSEYKNQPKFNAMLSFMVSVQVQVQKLMNQMSGEALPSLFDLSTPPIGNQLDIIGQWVGVSRTVHIPVSDVYFTWDSTYEKGWDYGQWQPADAPSTITSLPDDVYLNLILATIAANNWDGTTTGAYAIWAQVFPAFRILIQDNCNMTYNLGIVGGIVDSLTLALITGGYIHLRPEGVRIDKYFVPVDSNPAFCWDVETTLAKGWDEGSWLRELAPT
ncbi:MAG: DUF2612 domain-containing protein [Nitrospirota bacterium]|nr:DUF2612 domain-containing protein [Nitrospirota bacterium]